MEELDRRFCILGLFQQQLAYTDWDQIYLNEVLPQLEKKQPKNITPIQTPVQCSDCNKSYKHKRSLWLHKKYECGKEPQFCCPYCPLSRRFTQKHNLESHIKLHHSFL